MRDDSSNKKPCEDHPKLEPTPCELAVLRKIVELGTIGAAAKALCQSPRTAVHHVEKLKSKMGLRRLHEVIRQAERNGWLPDSEVDDI